MSENKKTEEKIEITEEAKGTVSESLRITENEVQHRSFAVRAEHVDEEKRTISLSFSSEEPVLRQSMRDGLYYEVLGHSEKEMDKDFISSGRAPLLLDHDQTKQIGVVQSVELVDGRARALVKVSRSSTGTEILQDIADGIRGNVSVGYYIREQEEVEERDGIKVMRATLWTPIEVSMVSIPADQTVGVGRAKETESLTTENQTTDIRSNDKMTDKNETPKVEIDVEAVRKEAAASEQARVREIAALGNKFGMTREADEYVKNNKGAEDFRAYVLENMDTTAKETAVESSRDDEIGMTDEEIKSFSFQRAIMALANPQSRKHQEAAAFELECSAAAEAAGRTQARGIMVPADVLKRELTAGAAGNGANVVDDELLAGSFIELLRNNMVVADLGATMLTGLQGDVSIPRQTSAASAEWIDPESTAISAGSDQGMDQVVLSPKTVGAYTDYSRQLLLQSSIDIENFVRQDLAQTLGIAIDLAALYGSGAAGQPTGLINSGIAKSSTFAGAVPTFAEIVDMESDVAAANALRGSLAYLTDFATRGGLKTQSKAGTEAMFVWDGDEVNGYRAVGSTQVTAGDVFFGNWAELLIGMWGGLDITVDPYSLSTKGAIRVVAFQSVDVENRHDASFVYGNDTV